MSIPKEHVHITFITPWIVFVGILGFQSITLRCKTPCKHAGLHRPGTQLRRPRSRGKKYIETTIELTRTPRRTRMRLDESSSTYIRIP